MPDERSGATGRVADPEARPSAPCEIAMNVRK